MNNLQLKYFSSLLALIAPGKLRHGWVVRSPYVNANLRIKFSCPVGHIRYLESGTFKNHKRKSNCAACSGNDPEEAEKYLIEFILLNSGKPEGPWKGSTKPYSFTCSEGHPQNHMSPNNIKRRAPLPICAYCTGDTRESNADKFSALIEEQGGRVVGTYINNTTPTDCICYKGHPCKPWPTSIQQGGGMCMQCSREKTDSKGVVNVMTYLTERDITFVREHRLDMHESKRRMFDFAFIYKDIKYLLEVDGEQHFKKCRWHKSDEDFLYSQCKDRTKTYKGLADGFCFIRLQNDFHDLDSITRFLDIVLSKPVTYVTLFLDNYRRYESLLNVPVNEEDVLMCWPNSPLPQFTLKQALPYHEFPDLSKLTI